MSSSGISTERSLTILSRMIASSYGIEVQFKEGIQTAMTDSKKVYIPSSWVTGSEEDAVLLEMLIDHEVAGHILHSDFDAQKFKNLSPLARKLFQALEDLRIEFAACKRFPGIPFTLNAGLKVVMNKHGFFAPPDQSKPIDPLAALFNGILVGGRAALLQGQEQVLGVSAVAWTSVSQSMFGPIWDRVFDVVKKSIHVSSSSDVAGLAQKIERILKNEEPEEEQSDQQSKDSKGSDQEGDEQGQGDQVEAGSGTTGSDDQQSTSQNQSGQGQSADSGDDSSPKSEAGSGDQSMSANSPANSSAESTSQAKKPTQAQLDAAKKVAHSQENELPQQADLSEMINKALKSSSTLGNSMGGSAAGTGAGSGPVNIMKSSPGAIPVQVDERARMYSNTLTSQLEMMLETQVTIDKRIGFTGKFLSRNKLTRVAVRDARVFKTKRRDIGLSTAVSIVRDDSGSMSSIFVDSDVTYSVAAQSLEVAFGRLFNKFDVPFAVTVFGSNVVNHKGFDDKWQTAEKNYQCSTGGGTMTGAAMHEAIPELAMQEADRKILLMITDGDASDFSAVKAAYSEASHHGIEAVTIFLGKGGRTSEFLRLKNLPVTATEALAKVQATAVDAISNAFVH